MRLRARVTEHTPLFKNGVQGTSSMWSSTCWVVKAKKVLTE